MLVMMTRQHDEALGDRVKRLRVSRGWSQDRLAREAGPEVEQTALSRVERNQTKEPGLFLMARIARALGVTLDELVGPMPQVTAVETGSHSMGDSTAQALALLQGQMDDVLRLAQEAVRLAADAKKDAQEAKKAAQSVKKRSA